MRLRSAAVAVVRTVTIKLSDAKDQEPRFIPEALGFRPFSDGLQYESYARQQLAFNERNLSVDYSVKVRLTAMRKSNVLRCISERFRMRGVFERSRKH